MIMQRFFDYGMREYSCGAIVFQFFRASSRTQI